MKCTTPIAALFGALVSLPLISAAPAPASGLDERDVDTRFPYTGPEVPVGDFVDNTINGNGKGFPRLVEPPAVKPASSKPRNNINVISTSYVPNGMNIHFQTPFGLGKAPTIHWGLSPKNLCYTTRGQTQTYDRTPPCSEITIITQCSQFFHDVQLTNLKSFTKYYYKIEASNGTTASRILDFTTARAAGDDGPFTVAVLNDMGYTNAQGTHAQLSAAANKDVAFAWHGGDISYADDWYTGVLPCEEGYSCYNGSSSHLPPGDFPSDYLKPLPKGEIANQGSPRGGDISVIYESNWDLWQQWMNKVTLKMPYLTMPGNHEAACAEFDGPGNILTAYLNDDKANSTAPKQELTYYSCPPSQRNFTAYQNRFRMPGAESGGVGNMWYSFDYGMVHFIALNGETDFAYSPESPFLRDLKGKEALPTENETYITDSGPFGYIENNEWKNNQAYEQIQWLSKDLAAVNREKTPWIIAMSHRPMYSSETASYQKNVRAAFEPLFLKHGVDAYLAGHIHWYERLFPLGNGTINEAAIVNNNTYLTAPGKSIAHIVNGMAGNIESHSTLEESKVLNITAVLDQMHYGFSKLRVESAEQITFEFVRGDGEGIGDHLTLVKAGSAAAKKLSAGERDLR